MNKHYSFFNDELALNEIRKHKWIESEKRGREIGFATAAKDWIEKYGQQWKQYRLQITNFEDTFAEKRSYRRFPYQMPITIQTSDQLLTTVTIDISFIGLACYLPIFVAQNQDVFITMNIQPEGSNKPSAKIEFRSRIGRIAEPREDSANLCYEAFFPFTEEARDYFRLNGEFLDSLYN